MQGVVVGYNRYSLIKFRALSVCVDLINAGFASTDPVFFKFIGMYAYYGEDIPDSVDTDTLLRLIGSIVSGAERCVYSGTPIWYLRR